MARAVDALVRGAAEWLLGQPPQGDSLYHGRAGVLLALLDAAQALSDERYRSRADVLAKELAESVDRTEDSSLFFGLTGHAVALDAAGRPEDAARALDHVRARFDGERWGPVFELLGGNAGIALSALRVGDVDLALAAVTPYVATADRTPGGVNWAVRPSPARSHHVAHGTLGIVLALARVGAATGRDDLVDLALAGAADVVARNEAGPDGFLVPHSDPPHRPELIERWSLGWCNGPTGDAQVFAALRDVTGDDAWTARADACWHTVTTSGLPRRLRPGFWDNHGRCCGTAGVLALALDRGDLAFAEVLVEDLRARALHDEAGVRWSNHEHRADPPDLEPRSGWAMGNAGILLELLRYAARAPGPRTAAGGPGG
ncbi:lanthionine synthetase C family protein [Nocardioides anomalus]|uniref:Lanthionine synthetase C family protein n=1 Tax=Nocardioides anomalus TaxID=2712223 RepID=A0A6G6WJX4_9ACTN|nr:lanthionine synthetase LanC family protein [Nocardioides anomalus]QIG45638.1 lanthionine synthetase C family protein [Nocardioides anomalus]